jgi:hypothetical protein
MATRSLREIKKDVQVVERMWRPVQVIKVEGDFPAIL